MCDLTVISLFDGMSCGQIALTNIGMQYDKYFASEVDKFAIQVTKDNYPDTIHIGDVSNISFKKGRLRAEGKKYRIRGKILLIGGSPCQGFSFAGKMKGASTKCNIEITTLDQYRKLKDEGFEFQGQSYLFWEYVRLREEIQPDYFLLENVMMDKKWRSMFNDAMGVEPIEINSALVSAQNRKRLYWTDIPNVVQPEDRGILIKDILETEVDEKYYMSQVATMRAISNARSRAFTKDVEKSGTLLANQAKQSTDGLYHIADLDMKGHARVRKLTPVECERLQTVPDDYTSSCSNSQRYKMLGNGWTVAVVEHIFRRIPS